MILLRYSGTAAVLRGGTRNPVSLDVNVSQERHWFRAFLAPQSAGIHARSPRRGNDENSS